MTYAEQLRQYLKEKTGINPRTGSWPGWPEMTYDCLEIAKVSAYNFLGCAHCGKVYPLEEKWAWEIYRHRQLFYCRQCAAKLPRAEQKKSIPMNGSGRFPAKIISNFGGDTVYGTD
jgi:hypothetical protein